MGKKIILDELADDDLVKKSQRGNEKAFRVLIGRHTGLIRSSLYRSGVKDCDVDDIVQLTHIKSWRKINTFKFKSAFGTWFYRISRNCFFDFARQRSNRSLKEVLYEDFCLEEGKNSLDLISGSGILFINSESPSDELTFEEKRQHLKSVLRKVKKSLRPHHKRVIELVIEQELSYAEAAKEMGCPVGTIMSRLFLARKEAQKIIEKKNLLNEKR